MNRALDSAFLTASRFLLDEKAGNRGNMPSIHGHDVDLARPGSAPEAGFVFLATEKSLHRLSNPLTNGAVVV